MDLAGSLQLLLFAGDQHLRQHHGQLVDGIGNHHHGDAGSDGLCYSCQGIFTRLFLDQIPHQVLAQGVIDSAHDLLFDRMDEAINYPFLRNFPTRCLGRLNRHFLAERTHDRVGGGGQRVPGCLSRTGHRVPDRRYPVIDGSEAR